MGEQRVHKGREVETWIREHPDVPHTIEQVTTAVDWNETSTSSALSRMIERYPEHMERIGRGVYRWHSKPITPKNAPPMAFMLQVLAEQDGIFLCRDSTSGKLYRLTEFTLSPA